MNIYEIEYLLNNTYPSKAEQLKLVEKSAPASLQTPSLTPSFTSSPSPSSVRIPSGTDINRQPVIIPSVQKHPEEKYIKYESSPMQNILDAILFILAGVLIIFLCDQLFKLGMSVGMRDTVDILAPYLKEFTNEK